MKIEINDSLVPKIGVDEQEALELLAIAFYEYKGIYYSHMILSLKKVG